MNAIFPVQATDQSAMDAAAMETALRIAEPRRADIERGVACLIREPWRVNRIIPCATSMDLGALSINLARRLTNAPPERRLGLLQLKGAFANEAFRDAWITMREAAE